MLTSARNTIYGRVDSLISGNINSEVILSIGSEKITATITNESIKAMDIHLGESAYALIKSSSIILAKMKPTRISARNIIKTTVTEIRLGLLNAEVQMRVSNNILTALITKESYEKLMIKENDEVYAIFKASSIIIGML